MITCPGWDVYMGDLGRTIKDALPPPPDWNMVSDLVGSATVRHFANYFGDVPDPPSEGQIIFETDTPIRSLDTTTDKLEPEVPSEYNKGKIAFDLNSAPEIKIEDKSKPFVIDDPMKMKSDPVGKKVIPGDPGNHSDGIKQPDKVDTGEEEPKPKQIIFDLPRPGATPTPTESPIPIPKNNGGGAAKPEVTDGVIPIPKQ